jgi:hypothetical protein
MVERHNERASGKTTGEEVTKEVVEDADKDLTVELPEERERQFQTPGFSRIRLQWRGPEAQVISMMHSTVQNRLDSHFADAYAIMWEIYDVVREKVTDPASGEALLDSDGLPIWRKAASGMYAEDWSRLTHRERERFLFQITTRLGEWEQIATESWAEAMFSKAAWEESFAIGFESLPTVSSTRPTVDDRTQRGRLESREDRYFAIYCTYYSKKAEALTRNMSLLAQRLKDVHVANGR